MATTRVNSIEIYYEEHGRGEPLLHALGIGWAHVPDECGRIRNLGDAFIGTSS